MKKILEKSTFKGVFAGFLVCCLFGIVVFADRNVKFLDSFGSSKKEYKLSADTWDAVMAELDQLRVDLDEALNEPSIGIPTGAIMAFDSSEGCPEGWEPYNLANGKFLMGTVNLSELLDSSGSSTATLSIENLPAHTHVYKDTMFSETFNGEETNYYLNGRYQDSDNKNRYYRIFNQGAKDVPGFGGFQNDDGVVFGNNRYTDDDNYPIYGLRVTSDEVCSKDFGDKVNNYNTTNIPSDMKGTLSYEYGDVKGSFLNMYQYNIKNNIKNYCYGTSNGKVTSTQSFSIQNPYVKVLYCKKTGGGDRGSTNNQTQTNAKCTYNSRQYDDGASVNGVYTSSSVRCLNASTTCTSKTAVCSNGTWKVDGTPVLNLYSSCTTVSANPNGYAAESCSCGSTDYGLKSTNNGRSCQYVYKCASCGNNNGGGGCFLAGTKVLTDKGLKNIETIEAGDLVLSYNELESRNEYKKVVKPLVHENNSDDIYELDIDGNVLKVTAPHRFYVLGNNGLNKGVKPDWISADELEVGDILLMSDGSTVDIDGINHYSNDGTVYNLEVEDNHNYYVDKGYLVHNKKDTFQQARDEEVIDRMN